MGKLVFTTEDIMNIESYLIGAYDGKVSENDEMYQKLKMALINKDEENNIDYNNNPDEIVSDIISKIQEMVISEENIRRFLMQYKFKQFDVKRIMEEVNSLNIDFNNKDCIESLMRSCSEKNSSLSPVSTLFIIDCITNLDVFHNITDSYAKKVYGIIQANLPTIYELFSQIAYSYLESDFPEPNDFEESTDKNDEFSSNGFELVNPADIDFDIPDEWKEALESTETKQEEINHNELLKNMTEFFITLPLLSKNTGYLKQLSNALSTRKKELYFETIKSMYPEYIQQLQQIMRHDESTNSYYYHGADSVTTAKKIMQEGLYMQYSDINRTAVPELDAIELLKYQYGHENVGSHAVIIIDQPIGESVVKYDEVGMTLVGTGQGKAGIETFNANHFIPVEYIVGYVDKDNNKIVYNPKYYKLQENQASHQI